MADTIIVRCAHCGAEIGEITFVEGKQVIGCKYCGKRTIVEIIPGGKVVVTLSGEPTTDAPPPKL